MQVFGLPNLCLSSQLLRISGCSRNRVLQSKFELLDLNINLGGSRSLLYAHIYQLLRNGFVHPQYFDTAWVCVNIGNGFLFVSLETQSQAQLPNLDPQRKGSRFGAMTIKMAQLGKPQDEKVGSLWASEALAVPTKSGPSSSACNGRSEISGVPAPNGVLFLQGSGKPANYFAPTF